MINKKRYAGILYPIIFLLIIMLAGCSFIGGVFKTGIGIGAFLVIALLVVILIISRTGKRNST